MNDIQIGRYKDIELSNEDRANGVRTAREDWQGWIKCDNFIVFVTTDGSPVIHTL